MRKVRVGVDIGGTFTDLVALDPATRWSREVKVPSTPKNPADGVLGGFARLLRYFSPAAVSAVIHSTTVASNALFGQLGLELPRIGFLTTRGFKDVIHIGRQRRPELYDLRVSRPRPLAERRFRLEVDERVAGDGTTLSPMKVRQVESRARELKRAGVQAVAVGFLNSYANSDHERMAATILRNRLRIPVTASFEVAPEHREFERFSTVLLNAALLPLVSAYLDELAAGLAGLGVSAPLLVMQSNGGVALANVVKSSPVTLIESGPASGLMGAAFYAHAAGCDDVISFDMGGTTAKAGLVRGGNPEVVMEFEVGGKVHSGRTVKGSGYPVRSPFVDLAECSAGGGTIVTADSSGALQVGPRSAGADPGPACYGLGGKEPTLTDACVILGWINPMGLLGGDLRIHARLAAEAFREKIAKPLGIRVQEAAKLAVEQASFEMSRILRIVTIERGVDPRNMVLVAFGGAGPMFVCALARNLQIRKALIPPSPGMISAYGLLCVDFVHHATRNILKRTSEIDERQLNVIFRHLEIEVVRLLGQQGLSEDHIVLRRKLDMRYLGQSYELTVPCDGANLADTSRRFHVQHRTLYGFSSDDDVEVVSARVVGIGKTERPRIPVRKSVIPKPPNVALSELRSVTFADGNRLRETPIYDRRHLEPGHILQGPSVVEQTDSTTLLEPDWQLQVDGVYNLILTSS